MSSAERLDLSAPSPASPVLERIRTLYQAARFVDAWAVASAPGLRPIRHWEGIDACLLGGRLARHLGSPRTATRLVSSAWRLAPEHPGVQHYRGLDWLDRRGAAGLRIAMMDWPQPVGGSPEDHADLLTLRARVASLLRDFRAAEAHLDEAQQLVPSDPWQCVERARCLAEQDRLEEALEQMEGPGAEKMFSSYLPGLQMRAHFLQMLGRVDEALAILEESPLAEQSATLHTQRYGLYHVLGAWNRALEALDRVESLSPLQEQGFRRWLTSQRVLASHRLGDRFRALVLARELKDPFHAAFVARLEQMDDDQLRRVQLEVPFVRQDFKTCAPATLAALSAYWGLPHDHQKLAEAMCYDGTALWRQREWAEANGWVTREFWVDRESAAALVRRGVPFALCTLDAFSSHMQAVIGTDPGRDTWIIREPSTPHYVEYEVTQLLRRFGAFGPLGCVFIPRGEAHRLDGLELPHSAACELSQRITRALARHDRQSAEVEMGILLRDHPEHPLRWHVIYQVACYDAHPQRQLESLERLLELHPENELLLQRKIALLREMNPDAARAELERTALSPVAPLTLALELAQVMLQDVRRAPECMRLLRRVLNRAGHHAGAVHAAASLLWNQGHLAAATDLYRIAAGMEGFQEGLFQSWYVACWQTGRGADALRELEDRFRRLGSLSALPGLTLAWAHLQQEDLHRCTNVLEEALTRLPEDGYLLLRAARLQATPIRNQAEASRLLGLAKGRVRDLDWWSAAGTLAEERQDTAEALRCYQEAANLSPTNADLQNRLSHCLSIVDGVQAVLLRFEKLLDRFPKHLGLRRLAAAWTRSHEAAGAEQPLREILILAPGDVWASRELSSLLLETKRVDAALDQISDAVARDPRDPRSLIVLGRVLSALDRKAEAADAWHRAFDLDPDQSEPMTLLLSHATSDAERHAELRSMLATLGRQTLRGDSLFIFAEQLRPVMDSDARLEILSSFHQQHPDSWQAACVYVMELCHQGRGTEALPIAQETVRRFGHLARTWMELAAVHQSLGDGPAELECARRAFDLGPWWPRAARALAETLERHGSLRPATEILDRAVRLSPREASLQVFRARLGWRLGERQAAIDGLESAIRLDPSAEWAWTMHREWISTVGTPQRAQALTRSLTESMPGDAHVWLQHASALLEAGARTEAMATLERAVQLDRTLLSAWDVKAQVLAAAGRFDEAVVCCEEGARHVRADRYVLEGRAAWVEAAQGRTAAAVARMRVTLQSNAGYTWGWGNLVVWLGQLKLHAEAREALEKLRALLPRDSWIHRQSGLIHLSENQIEAAMSEFRLALAINPADRPSAEILFDLLFDARQIPQAAEALQHLQIHLPGGETTRRELLLALQQGRSDEAMRLLKIVCSAADLSSDSLASAIMICLRNLPRSGVLAAIQSVLASPLQNPHLPMCLLLAVDPAAHPVRALWTFARLPVGARASAAACLVSRLTESRKWILIRLLLWTHRKELLATDAAWGQVGYALTSAFRPRAAVRWLSDWERRQSAEPWMVFNLCLSMTRLGRHAESLDLAYRALDRWWQGEGIHSLRVHAAFEEALRGNVARAGELLGKANPENATHYRKALHELAGTLVRVHGTEPAERKVRLRAELKDLAMTFPFFRAANEIRDVRCALARTGRSLRRATRSPRAVMWFAARLYWPVVVLAPVLALGALSVLMAPQIPSLCVIWLAVLGHTVAWWKHRR